MKVNLGCNRDIRPEWLNIDIANYTDKYFLSWDLRNGLPLQAKDAELIVSCHFLEHLHFDAIEKLSRDCFNSLASGGKLRSVIPNFKGLFKAYLEGNFSRFDYLRKVYRNYNSLLEIVNDGVYQYANGENDHKSIIDEDYLIDLYLSLGFKSAYVDIWRPEVDGNEELRRLYSVIVEAIK